MFSKATLKERRQYYREEWNPKDLPDFISTDIKKREFGFDHNGRGPNDRYKTFKGTESLRKFLRFKAPFAAYISVAFYNNPRTNPCASSFVSRLRLQPISQWHSTTIQEEGRTG